MQVQLESFCQFRDQEYRRIIKYVSTRWLSLEAAVGRALKLLPLLKSYFLSEEDNSPRFERLEAQFENPVLEVYLLFYQFALQVFITFNMLLQREDPLVSRLNCHIQKFFRKLGCKFLNINALANTDPANIDFENAKSQKNGKFLMLVYTNIGSTFICTVQMHRNLKVMSSIVLYLPYTECLIYNSKYKILFSKPESYFLQILH